MVKEEEYLENIFESVAVKLKINKWRCVRKNLGEKIVNYVGNFVYATIVDENSGKKTEIIVKRAPYIQNFDELIGLLYETEIYVYNCLLPMFKSLNTKETPNLFPESYFADNRVMVLKDMTLLGFQRYTRGDYLDSDHVNLALKTVSKFHALSFISFERKIKLPNQDILKPYYNGYPHYYEPIIKYVLGKYQYVFENTCHEGYIRKLYTNIAKNLRDCVLKVKSMVYGHGDFWKENILFKYSREKPAAACLVDYQVTRLISPAQDVIYLLMNGTDSVTRKKHCELFLSNYYSSLRLILHNNGLDAASVYSEEDFHHDCRAVFPFTLSLTIFSFALWLGLESIDSILTQENLNVPKDKREPLEQKLRTIILNIIFDFTKLGYIAQ